MGSIFNTDSLSLNSSHYTLDYIGTIRIVYSRCSSQVIADNDSPRSFFLQQF